MTASTQLFHNLYSPMYCVLFCVHDVVHSVYLCTTGTPTEQSWPGIISNEEFVTYNYPHYRAETLSNHTPRYITHYNCTTHSSTVRYTTVLHTVVFQLGLI